MCEFGKPHKGKKYIGGGCDNCCKLPEYYYKGNKLYNIKKIKGLNYCGHDLQANWKDPKENNKEKLGNFYLKELEKRG